MRMHCDEIQFLVGACMTKNRRNQKVPLASQPTKSLCICSSQAAKAWGSPLMAEQPATAAVAAAAGTGSDRCGPRGYGGALARDHGAMPGRAVSSSGGVDGWATGNGLLGLWNHGVQKAGRSRGRRRWPAGGREERRAASPPNRGIVNL